MDFPALAMRCSGGAFLGQHGPKGSNNERGKIDLSSSQFTLKDTQNHI